MTGSEIHTAELPYPDKGDRRVWIYVPSFKEGAKLPVIYMTDGQNLFYEESTPYGSWGVREAVEGEIADGGEGAVIVGIDNGNIYRDSELTPESVGEILHREQLSESFSPEGEIFDSFLTDTVMPYVESRFPVRADRNGAAVCGSSSGGLMSFFSGMTHADKFSFVGALSPAFILYSEEDWRSFLMKKLGEAAPYLYLYTGSGDRLEEELCRGTEMMYDLLGEIGYPPEKMNEVVLLDNRHNERAWREIFPDVLRTFLGKAKRPD